MFESLDILRMAHGLAAHTGARQAVIAQNVANADTPGFRAKDLAGFAETYRDAGGLDLRQTRSGHLASGTSDTASLRAMDAGGQASPNGNTVSLETEMLRGVEAKRGHDLALAVYRTSLDVLRTSLGRGR